MTDTPRGIRNHNPGNLVWVETIQWQGQTGNDGRFCTFDSAASGIRALCKQLLVDQDKYGLRTVRDIISRWAPPAENDTGAYVNAVAHLMGVRPNAALELHNDLVLTALGTAIITHENGQQPYAEELIHNSARRALGWAFVPDVEPVDLVYNDAHTASETQSAAPIEQRDLSGIPPREEPAMSDTAQTTPSFDWSSLLNVGGTFVTAATTALGSPLAGALVGGLVSAFKPVLQDKITKEIGRHTDAATANMVGTELTKVITDTTAAVTQKSDPATAIAEVRADPAKLAVVEQAVDQKLADMLPVLNEMHRQAQERFAAESADRNDAASRVIRVGWNIQKPLVQGGLLINIGTVAFLLLALVVQIILAADHKPDPTLIAFGGPIIVMTLRGLERAFAFAFGGTPEGSPADLSRQGKPQ